MFSRMMPPERKERFSKQRSKCMCARCNCMVRNDGDTQLMMSCNSSHSS